MRCPPGFGVRQSSGAFTTVAIQWKAAEDCRSPRRCRARPRRAGFKPEWGLDRGIEELIKGFTILRNSVYSNV